MSTNSNRNSNSKKPAIVNPDAKDDSYSFTEGLGLNIKTLDVLANDTGTGTLTLQPIALGATSALGVAISIVGNQIQYDPTALGNFDYLAAGETIFDTITYSIAGANGTDTATVKIKITGTNDKPTFLAVNHLGAVMEDASPPTLTNTGEIQFDDLDLTDTHVVKVKADGDNPLGGKLVATVTDAATGAGDGTVTWIYSVDNSATQWLAEGQTVTETFKITIDDGNGGKITQVVTVAITGDNDAPTIVSSCHSDVEGAVFEDDQASTSGKIVFRDVDLTDDHTATSLLTGTTSGNESPLGTLTLVVREGRGGHHRGDDNHDGHNGWTQGRGHGGGGHHHGGRHDDDHHGGHGSKGSVGWTYTINDAAAQSLAAGETVTETYTVTISDGNGGTDTETVTITITGTNDGPVLASALADVSSPEDAVLSFVIPVDAFTDVDLSDVLTYTATLQSGDSLPAWLAFDGPTRTFSGTPPPDFNGSLNVTVTASDGTLSASGTFVLEITPVNDAPMAVADALSATEDTAVTYTAAQLVGNDSDGDPELNQTLTIASVTNGTGGTVVLNIDGTVTFTPTANFNGPANFTYTISDGITTSAPATVSVTVNVAAVNDNPLAGDDPLSSIAEDSGVRAITFATLLGNDGPGPANESGQTLTITAVGNAVGGTVAIVSGEVRFTPTLNYFGPANFDYTIADNGTGALTDMGTASFTITSVNDAPALANVGPTATSTEQVPGLLDTNAVVSDVELDGSNNYGGASLTIARNGGASSQDIYGFDTSSGASFTVSGSNLQSGGQTFATYSQTGGMLTIAFTSSGTAATSALADNVMQRITYMNTSDTPPASVTLNYTFNDGNSGAQGSGGAGSTTGSITVSITDVPDTPPPVALGEKIFVNNDPVDIPEWLLLLNDTTGAVDVNNVAVVVSGSDTATHTPGGAGSGHVTFNDGDNSAPYDGGSFSYQAANVSGALSAVVTAEIVNQTGVGPNPAIGSGTIIVNNSTADIFFGSNGNDTLVGSGGGDTYAFRAGGDGTDTINDGGNSGTDRIVIGTNGAALTQLNFENIDADNEANIDDDLQITTSDGTGTTTINVIDQYNSGGVETITFVGGTSYFGYALGSYSFTTDRGDPVVGDNVTSDVIPGTTNGQTLYGGSSGGIGGGNDLLFGNGGADTLNGGAGSDLLVGGSGNDRLTGGDGNDWLVGGTGADTFVMTTGGGNDTITDYLLGTDLIDLSSLLQGETAATISSFVSYNAGTGALSVDVNGTVDGPGFTQIATIDTSPSGLNLLKCRVQAFQLHTGVSCREVPIGLGVARIATRAPCGSLGRERSGVGNAAGEALAGENGQLGLGQIEPAPVLGRVVPFESLDDAAGLGRLECLIQ